MSLGVSVIILILGLVLLVVSADFLIKISVRLAWLLRLSTLFIGLILVAFGTSLPEAAVSIVAAVKNSKDIALGNVVGSNIANIGLAVGLAGLFNPLKVEKSLFRREIPVMLVSCLALYGFCWDGLICRWEGGVFLLGFAAFCFFSFKNSKAQEESEEFTLSGPLSKTESKPLVFLIFCGCLFFLVLGADLMVNSGVNIANFFGISPWVIAITVFAVGTSLPELAASVAASIKKVSSISIGNVVGSNIFNILLVLGLASLIRPIEVDRSILNFELPLMIAFSVVVSLFMMTRNKVSRFEAGVLLLFYCIFIVFLFIR
ncbi:MAG: calcium/sodium antiporter [Candidatus Omnitrophica bacterium]|nr:calcium/sodium antiporter [Candidatus Omnitrophota bacterium]